MAFHTFFAGPPNEFQPQGHPDEVSGHGRTLTDDQKAALIKICHDLAHWGTFSEQPKSFWMEASRIFQLQADRKYGWQACRRCMAKWEADNRPACLERPSVPSPTASEADLGVGSSSSSHQDDGTNTPATNSEATETEADAEDLPRNLCAPVRHSTKRTAAETTAKRKEFCRSVVGVVKDVERKIQYMTDALDDDHLDHRCAIDQTFNLLKTQIAGSMERFENRAPE
ncbi:hypothetical protein N7486_008652 [Penicillium sp. IBT 16267x]|nr:hypothetical protein N7486_008652 [Penicillium sp. IBT 16267x]